MTDPLASRAEGGALDLEPITARHAADGDQSERQTGWEQFTYSQLQQLHLDRGVLLAEVIALRAELARLQQDTERNP